jgi:hypothetical protein
MECRGWPCDAVGNGSQIYASCGVVSMVRWPFLQHARVSCLDRKAPLVTVADDSPLSGGEIGRGTVALRCVDDGPRDSAACIEFHDGGRRRREVWRRGGRNKREPRVARIARRLLFVSCVYFVVLDLSVAPIDRQDETQGTEKMDG